ncbi:alpha/beta fold hydrolase [Aquabacter cavernae]|uniref:alpha/beta fold hydrolase n=1 Tax=Aquabacter cavernae TaxID=2496029 RepID=UPI000F8F4296|nr:alpha/beta hydrolase [Aquabacter cavernae]
MRHAIPRTLETGLGPVELLDSGTGPALLALHGGMGGWDQGQILAQTLFGLRPPFRLLSPSRPGYLGTPLAGRVTPAMQADLFAASLDRLGVDKALVAAVSAGGPGAVAFAARHPDRCSGLILVSACTGGLAMPPGAARRLPFIRLATRIPPLAGLLSLLARANPTRAARRSILDEEVLHETLRHPEAGPLLVALQNSVASRLAARLPGTLNDVAQFGAMGPLPLSGLRVPVLAIHGTGDRVVPVSHLDRVEAEVAHAAILRIPRGEHVCLVTHLDAVRTAAARLAALAEA